jgi:hypothetical protein
MPGWVSSVGRPLTVIAAEKFTVIGRLVTEPALVIVIFGGSTLCAEAGMMDGAMATNVAKDSMKNRTRGLLCFSRFGRKENVRYRPAHSAAALGSGVSPTS